MTVHWTILTLFGLIAFCLPVAAQEPPSLERQIDPTSFDDGARSIVLRVTHDPEPQQPTSVMLVKSRYNVRRGDLGDVLVETFDHGRNKLDEWNAPHPHDRTGETAPGSEARYVLPYSKDLLSVHITDLRTGAAMEADLYNAIHSFCIGDPGDPACEQVDLAAHISPRVGLATQSVPVGDTVQVELDARFENLQGETSGVAMLIAPFFVSPNLDVMTDNETSFIEGRVDGSFSKEVSVTYSITCREAGLGRIFPQVTIFASGGAAVIESDPSNNQFNTIIDVHCLDS